MHPLLKQILDPPLKPIFLVPPDALTDSEVEAAEDLLKSQFPLVDGLEDPSIVGDLVTPAASEFCTDNQHRVTLGVSQCHFLSHWGSQSI